MLDDLNVLKQHNAWNDLELADAECEQTNYKVDILDGENDQRPIADIVMVGMGGSALAGLIAKSWLELELSIPMEVVRTYDLPKYVDHDSLVIISSYSGN